MKKDMQLENLMNRYFDGVRVGYEITAPAQKEKGEIYVTARFFFCVRSYPRRRRNGGKRYFRRHS